MCSAPVVSVIIPTYNHAHFLREALTSLRAQSYDAWEAIVVNNYSEDDTVSVVESFADPRIRLENFRNNGIIGASRNQGVKLSRGVFIAFLDSDDIWYPEKLARCMEAFAEEVDLVSHGFRLIGDVSPRDLQCGPEKKARYDDLVFTGNCITPSATVVRKAMMEKVGGFTEAPEMVTAEDYHLSIKLAKLGCRMLFLKDILTGYRIHKSNQSGSALRHLQATLNVVNEFLPVSSERNIVLKMKVLRRYCIAYYGAARGLQRNGHIVPSFSLLFRAVRYWPFYIKIYFAIALSALLLIKSSRK